MNTKSKNKLLNMYNTLIDNEVIFYYCSEVIPYGEITKLEITQENNIRIELNGFEKYEVNYEDFQENHSKEGINYHTWQQVRDFDNKLEELII